MFSLAQAMGPWETCLGAGSRLPRTVALPADAAESGTGVVGFGSPASL
jgi:hypothetical protein